MTTSAEQLVPVQFGNYNRKTGEWCPGLGHPTTGNRSIDRSWVFFEVNAESQEMALVQVKRYCANQNAKFAGMQVTLMDGKAFNNGAFVTDF